MKESICRPKKECLTKAVTYGGSAGVGGGLLIQKDFDRIRKKAKEIVRKKGIKI